MENPFHPETYAAMMATEIPSYEQLQSELAAATAGARVARILDLGTGTGITARAVLDRHPGAHLVGIDENDAMLDAARAALPVDADLRVARLQDPLPPGPFDLVVSALAVHHLDEDGKSDLFQRVASVLRPGGSFVLGDLIVPDDPADIVTPIDGIYDLPSPLANQITWLRRTGLDAHAVWVERDLAVIVSRRPA